MVYLRVKKFKRKKGEKSRSYYYLVEAKRINGKVKQKVIRYLGNAETIYKDYQQLDKIKILKKN